MKVLLAGAPGSGKGTQAALLASELRLPHITSGGLVRHEIAAGSPAGLAARRAVARGALVPDEVLVEVLRPALALAGSRGGYVLDGFPRTVAQAESLGAVVTSTGPPLDVVVHLEVPPAVLTQRLLARGRADDDAAVIEHRLAVYAAQTLPMLDWYARRQQLVVVAGDGTVEEVSAAVTTGLQERAR